MSCFTWNCHKLGNLRTRRELVEIIRVKDPAVVFLAKTLTDDARLEFVQSSIGFYHRWVIPRVRRSGGLVLYWKASINLTVEGSNRYYIDAVIDKNTKNEWRFTGFYGSGGTRWRCPQARLVKINSDGAIFGESNMSGIGVVIWDSNGAVLASCSEKIPQAYKAKEIEALAALKALSFAFEVGFLSAILKGDSLGLIQALKSEERNLSPTGLLIKDVKLFANNYVSLLYSHIKRNGNSVAHSLAKNALCIPNFQVWMEDVQ